MFALSHDLFHKTKERRCCNALDERRRKGLYMFTMQTGPDMLRAYRNIESDETHIGSR
jgi:hypothetical protein